MTCTEEVIPASGSMKKMICDRIEPWCLVPNLPDHRMALHYSARNMWIEEMLGDMK
jgi:hypothetical protein